SPRKLALLESGTPFTLALQWSRGVVTAETARAGVHGHTDRQVLQWSRGVVTAETTHSPRSACRDYRFNGAAVLSPRKRAAGRAMRSARPAGFNGAAVLSPRKRRRRSPRRGPMCCFNGAAVLSPRKRRNVRRSRSPRASF